jgi:peptidoglycan/xylan/chitin deacetylase (PgdA/CDA1 family)
METRLAGASSRLARLRSRVAKNLVSHAVPQSILVTRGKPRRKNQVALTFDDGPDEMTRDYLDCLAQLGARATFFLIGENAKKHPDLVLEYVRAGHEVAGHGYTHRVFPELAPAVLVDELERTADLLPASIAPRPLVRPPQGRVTPQAIARVAAAGFTSVLWSLDSDDCRTDDPDVVVERVNEATGGEIILLHELQPWTLAAVPRIVENLRRSGFEFVTVGELLGY